jgi:hypothetical protein
MKYPIFYLLFFSFSLALFRIIPHPPNFTPVLSVAIMAPLILRNKVYGSAIPIIAMFLSDIILGFHVYQIVVYSTILIISFVAPLNKNYFFIFTMCFGSSLFFYLTTNFAVWLFWDYYPKTIEGLISCYYLAIPFFKNTLLSTFFYTGLLMIIYKYLVILNDNTNNFIESVLRFVRK